MIKPPFFDVSGVDGASGISGPRYHTTASRGSDGVSGMDGTDGQSGTTAGTVAVRLTTPITTANIPENVVLANPIDADVKLEASIVCPAGRLQKLDTIMKINLGGSMCFHALGGHGGRGGDGGYGQHGGKGYKYGAYLTFFFNKSIAEYAWRTVERMQLNTLGVLMAVLVATEEMAVTQVKAVMAGLEDLFESLFPKPTPISLCSMVPTRILPEEGVQQGDQGSEASFFRIILSFPLSEINSSIRQWRKRWERWLVVHVVRRGRRRQNISL